MASSTREDILMWVLLAPYIAIWGFTMLYAGLAFANTVTDWLIYGVVNDYDLYWMFADVKCAATNFVAKGFDGMTLCREEINFTPLVGLNKILRFIFDISLIVILPTVGLLLPALYMALVSSVMDFFSRHEK